MALHNFILIWRVLFTFIYEGDIFIQSDVQLAQTVSGTIGA